MKDPAVDIRRTVSRETGMSKALPMAELWRGDLLESAHAGHAAVCDGSGRLVGAWGDPEAVIFPRSSDSR